MASQLTYFVEECTYVKYIPQKFYQTEREQAMPQTITKVNGWKRAQVTAKRMSEITRDVVFHFDGTHFDPNSPFKFYYLNGKRISEDHAIAFLRDRNPYEYTVSYIGEDGEHSVSSHVTLRAARNSARFTRKSHQDKMVAIKDRDGKIVMVGRNNRPSIDISEYRV